MPLKKIKAPNGMFYASGTIGGNRIRQSLGTRDPQQAEEARAQLEARLWSASVYGAEAVATFEDAALSYLQDGHDPRFVAVLLKHFRGKALRTIKPKDIRDAARKLYPNGKPSTWNRNGIAPARAIINHAADQGWCQPMRVKQFPVEKPKRVAVGIDWINSFRAQAVSQGNPRLAALCRFMFETGVRIGEAVALESRHIDHVNKRADLGKTKNGETYSASFSADMRDELVNLTPRNGLVFGYSGRGSVYGPWRTVCDRAGLPYVPPHQAGRHSLATALHEQGWLANDIADAGRWKSTRLVQDTYIHATGKSQAAADLIAKKLANPYSSKAGKVSEIKKDSRK